MNDVFSKLRKLSHEHTAMIWQLYKRGEPLDRDSRLLAEAMARHPEWERYWELADDFGDREVLIADEMNPFAAVAVEVAVEGMIAEDGDPTVRATYEVLVSEGLSHEDARAEIARFFCAVYWELGTHRIAPTEGMQRWNEVLRRMREGESPSDIWPE